MVNIWTTYSGTNKDENEFNIRRNTFDNRSNSVRIAFAGDNGVNDAFGRLRVSNPVTLFDSKQIFDNLPLFWDDQEVSGSGTSSTYSQAMASTTMGVSATTTGKRVRQTFMCFNYQPGKSQLIFTTGVLDKSGGGAGITRAWGYFNDDNGLFLRDNEGTIELVRRTSTSGSAVDNAVSQSSWNLDTMDGTGSSGITLDFTKTQILIIDFEWLGVGRVRMGFVVDGKIYYAHEFNNANNLSTVYMSTPNLPLRYEIENDGTGVASEIEHICSSVISEGGNEELGTLRHKDSGSVSSLANTATYAILGIRLKSTTTCGVVKIENISSIATSNDQFHWELRLNPTIAGTFTYSDETNSVVQTATGSNANTVTGGTEIDGGYVTTTQAITFTIPNALRIGSAIDGTPDELVLVVTPITNNMTMQASITWRESI